MEKFLKSKYGLLIFSLGCGVAYFILIILLVANIKYSYLLGIFFFPTVICGAALCIYKTIKNLQEVSEFRRIKSLIILHIFVILLAVSFLLTVLLT